MRGVLVGFVLSFVLLSVSVNAATYYVDATGGNDNNLGTSEGQAWKTIGEVNDRSFSPGDSILFKRGETWREQLTVPSSGSSGNPITFGAYGSGALPIVSGMREVTGWDTAGSWTGAGWQTAWDPTLNSGYIAGTTRNYRTIMDADTSSYDGTKVRITMAPWAGGPGTFDGTSVGLMTTGDDFDGAPTRITWNTGSNGATITEPKVSDEIEFSFDKTKRYGFHVYFAQREDMRYGTSVHGYYYNTGSDDTLTQNIAYDLSAGRGNIEKVDVYTGGGAENVWTMSLATNPQRLVIDGTEYIEAETANDVDSTYRWFYDSGATTLHLYATENPAIAYSSMDYAANVHGISMDAKSYITIQDLEVQGGIWGIVVHNACSNILIHDCTVGKYAYGAGIRLRGKTSSPYTQVTDVEVYDNVVDGDYHNSAVDYKNGVALDGIWLGDSVVNCKVYNNTVTDWTHSGIVIICTTANCETQYNEIYGNSLSAPNTNYFRGIDISDAGTDGQAAYNKIYRNLIFNTTVRNQPIGDHNEFYYNIIHTVTQGARRAGVPGGIGMFASAGKTCHDNKIYNNVIYNVADHGISADGWAGWGDVQSNLFRNNIVMNWGAGKYGIFIRDHATVLDNTYQNNLLYKSGVNDVVDYRGVDRTIAEFNSENGSNGDVIGSNIGGDPLLTDPASGDFHLQPGSPAIDTGTDVGLTTDFDGNAIIGNPDIGAYEYQGIPQLPYNGPHNIPGRIEAEDYDTGGEGVAYHDTTSGNTGTYYRSDDVDIKLSNDTDAGYAVGWMSTSEWLEYTVNVLSDGDYSFYFRVLSQVTTGQFHVEMDGIDITGLQSVPYTGEWDSTSWIAMEVSNVSLTAGQHVMRVFVDNQWFDLNYIEMNETIELPADLNNDGNVDLFDLGEVTSRFGLTSSDPGWDDKADVVVNGEIDVFDLVFVASRFT